MARTKGITSPWETERPGMLLVHIAEDEMQALDTIQGGKSIDRATGVRQYLKLGELIKVPEIREIFLKIKSEVVADIRQDNKLDPPLSTRYKAAPEILPPFRKTEKEKLNPLAQQLSEEGVGSDKEIAWLPYNVVSFFIELNNGQIEINPNTQLLMFGWFGNLFKSIVRIAAPIVAIAASPFTGGTSLALLGTAGLAAGASGLAHLATGAKGSEALKAAALSGVTAGLGGIGASLGMNPALAHGLARTGAGLASGEKLGPAATQGLVQGVGHYGVGKIGQAMGKSPSIENQFVSEAAKSAGVAPAASSPGMLGNLGSTLGNLVNSIPGGSSLLSGVALGALGANLLPNAALGALAYKGQKEAYEHGKKRHEGAKAQEQQLKEELGFNTPWVPVKPKPLTHNPEYYNEPDWARRVGAFENPYLREGELSSPYPSLPAYYRKGGQVKNPEYHDQSQVQSVEEGVLVKGPGKGQQDLIKTSVPENSYIIDASATGMFGDGSSDAGAKILKEFEEQVKRRAPPKKAAVIAHHIRATTRQLPVWLSDSEYKFDPLTVTLLGEGSSKKGADMLKRMVENIRYEKSKKGGGLPVKAKSPWHYLESRS